MTPEDRLIRALDRNTAAQRASVQSETNLMATLDDLTAVLVTLKTDLDALVAIVKAGGFTPAQQAQLDAAVTALAADVTEAAGALPVPPPPAP